MTHYLAKTHLEMTKYKATFRAFIFLFLSCLFSIVDARPSISPITSQNRRPTKTWMHSAFVADFRLGEHIQSDQGLSTGRTGVSITEKIEFTKDIKLTLGGRYENEAIYNWLPKNYPQDLRDTQSNLAWPTDTNLKIKYSHFLASLGYQQIVWGETFGNNISDVVNPKDYRELNLENSSRARLQIPAINLQWLSLHSSAQLILIPRPAFNWMPKIGSDFAPKAPAVLGTANLLIDDQDPTSFNKAEWGTRFSNQFKNLDIALFYFNYFDRMPVYSLISDFSAPNTFKLIPHHRIIESFGLNATYDFSGYLVRLESVYSTPRSLNIINSTGLTEVQYNELKYILGLDLPGIQKFTWSFQYSEQLLKKDQGFSPNQNRLDLNISRNLSQDSSANILLSIFTMDGSQLCQAKYTYALNHSWEIEPRIDLFGGSAESIFGQYRRASRAIVSLKGIVL